LHAAFSISAVPTLASFEGTDPDGRGSAHAASSERRADVRSPVRASPVAADARAAHGRADDAASARFVAAHQGAVDRGRRGTARASAEIAEATTRIVGAAGDAERAGITALGRRAIAVPRALIGRNAPAAAVARGAVPQVVARFFGWAGLAGARDAERFPKRTVRIVVTRVTRCAGALELKPAVTAGDGLDAAVRVVATFWGLEDAAVARKSVGQRRLAARPQNANAASGGAVARAAARYAGVSTRAAARCTGLANRRASARAREGKRGAWVLVNTITFEDLDVRDAARD
jgi:hypothetical protein